MDDELLARLTRAEEDLVSAMLTGDGELAVYEFAWTSLLDEISQASALGTISNTTIVAADDVVARVSALVECCLSLSSLPPPSPPVFSSDNSSPSPFHTNTFIQEAYSWLLENISNPYPSSTVKVSLAQRYNCSLSAINSWFVNARRRMGWTGLCRDYFNGCRAEALDAAYRALVEEDPDRQLPADIIHAFVSVKVAVEELYSATLTKSALASDLDGVVKDVSVREGVPVNKQKYGEPKGTMEMSNASDVDPQNEKLVAHNCYLTPDHSPSSSSIPLDESLADNGGDDEDIVPPVLVGRKRRFSSSEGAHVTTSELVTRLVKCPRVSPSVPSLANYCTPSPTRSAVESLKNDQEPRSIPVTEVFRNSGPCNRHLSDADTTRSPTRSPGPMAEPRLHAVSDPLPLSVLESEHSIDEWFKTNFDALFTLPPPVEVTEPDHLTQWEVELFNNYIIPEGLQKTLAPPIQDNQVLFSTDLTAFDDILQSLESGGFVAPQEIIHSPTMVTVSDPTPQGLSLLSGLSWAIDWTALSEDAPEPTCSLFSRSYSSLPEIDLSILQLPQVWTTVAT